MKRLLAAVFVLLTLAACQQPAKPTAVIPPLDTATIDRLTGLKGTMNEKEHVYKITYPRTDLHVTVADPSENVVITPPMALTSWAAFQRCDDCVMVMGDTVLTEGQVNAVMSVALDNGLQVTALHNHLANESPKIMFMHISGEGTEEQLAAAVAKVYAKVKETSVLSGRAGLEFRIAVQRADASGAPTPNLQDAIAQFDTAGPSGVHVADMQWFPVEATLGDVGPNIIQKQYPATGGSTYALLYTDRPHVMDHSDSLQHWGLTSVRVDQTKGPAVYFTFDAVGTEYFASLTERNIHRPLGMLVDDQLISAPVINSVIPNGIGMITLGGGADVELTKRNAQRLYKLLMPDPIDPASSTLDPAKIDSILGVKGDFAKGVYKMTIGLTTHMDDHALGNAMGVNTWAVFVGSDDRSAVMGDFAVLDIDLQGVLKSLRKSNINIVSIHNHMTEESPRIMFLHYWAIGKTTDLAAALKSALDTQHH